MMAAVSNSSVQSLQRLGLRRTCLRGNAFESEPEPEADPIAVPQPEPEPSGEAEGSKHLPASATFKAALELLGLLHAHSGEWQQALGLDPHAFENPSMSRKLEEQLSDPVAVPSGALPRWCRQWMAQADGAIAGARAGCDRSYRV